VNTDVSAQWATSMAWKSIVDCFAQAALLREDRGDGSDGRQQAYGRIGDDGSRQSGARVPQSRACVDGIANGEAFGTDGSPRGGGVRTHFHPA
jgi:hypothetical protein